MKKLLPLLLILLNLHAMSQNKIQGEYFFRKMEMVAGFNFSANGTFQFFYSYGAVDRNATGSFTVQGDTLKLKSDKVSGRDFTVTAQSKTTGGYFLSFTHPNKYLLQHIRCLFLKDGKMEEAFSDSNGEVHIDLPHCDSVYVQHSLYPDVATLIKDAANEHNRFTLTLNPSLEQVSFKGIDFKMEGENKITCMRNYFMDMPDITFEKE